MPSFPQAYDEWPIVDGNASCSTSFLTSRAGVWRRNGKRRCHQRYEVQTRNDTHNALIKFNLTLRDESERHVVRSGDSCSGTFECTFTCIQPERSVKCLRILVGLRIVRTMREWRLRILSARLSNLVPVIKGNPAHVYFAPARRR